MPRILTRENIEAILYGSAFLSTGGGGPLSTGLAMLKDLAAKTEIALPLVDPAEMEADACAATAIGFGSPDAFLNTPFGAEAEAAFDTFVQMMGNKGHDVRYLCSLEYAGFNTFTPMYVAIRRGLGLLDIDLNGKAVMDLSSSLGMLTGQRLYPMVLAAADGSTVVVEAGRADDIAFGEQIMLEMAKQRDMRLGVSNNLLDKAEVMEKTIHHAMSRAEKVGNAILACRKSGADIMAELSGIMKIRQICRGPLVRIEMLGRGKFNTGTLVVEDGGQETRIHFHNEALAAECGGKMLITAPDMICIMRADTLAPITCSEVREGMELLVAATPADARWHGEAGFAPYKKHLLPFGYEGGAVEYQ